MTIDENGTITIYNGDYGLPIVFETVDFAVGDKVVFVISNNPIPPKEFTVDADGYTFDLIFDKTEAINIAAAANSAEDMLHWYTVNRKNNCMSEYLAMQEGSEVWQVH